MKKIEQIKPNIRVSHYFRFTGNTDEENFRMGYCYAFHLFDGGQGEVVVENKRYPVQKGSLIYLDPKQQHAFHTDPIHTLSSYNIYFDAWMDVPMETSQVLARSISQFDPEMLTQIEPCPELDQLPTYIPLQHHTRLTELFAHIINVQDKKITHYAKITSSLLYGWILELCQEQHVAEHFDYRIQRIIEKMDRHWKSYSRSEEWLRESGLKRTQFYNLFKKMTGLSPKAYVLKLKMNQAAAALLESNRSITEIAEELDYPSIHFFSKQFSDYYGQSPLAFRQQSSRMD